MQDGVRHLAKPPVTELLQPAFLGYFLARNGHFLLFCKRFDIFVIFLSFLGPLALLVRPGHAGAYHNESPNRKEGME
ncbi:hypothetical protein D5272_03250 [bacterium D16-76]|nr:hypothetical protein [bacterium D16-76]